MERYLKKYEPNWMDYIFETPYILLMNKVIGSTKKKSPETRVRKKGF